jgi:low affinity Fe/Cu permease
MKSTIVILILIALCLWFIWWVICPDLKKKDLTNCIITNQGVTIICEFEGRKIIAEVKK